MSRDYQYTASGKFQIWSKEAAAEQEASGELGVDVLHLIDGQLLEACHRVLTDAGTLTIVTDNKDYMRLVAKGMQALELKDKFRSIIPRFLHFRSREPHNDSGTVLFLQENTTGIPCRSCLWQCTTVCGKFRMHQMHS